jgi:mRNA interferase RelE/StbE
VFDVRLGRDAEKFYDKADSKLKDRLKELFAVLAQNPVPVDAYDVKKISGPENEYRIRLSSYRVVYCVDWDDKVVRVGKIERKDDCTYD